MHDIVFVPIGYLTKTVAWKKWLHHVVKKLRNWELKEGAIVCKNGNVIAVSHQFHINMNEFKEIICCFVYQDVEMVSLMGITYCIKSISDSQLVAFNGKHYLIVSQTESMFIFFKCTTRLKSILVADWLKKTAQKIQERHY
ncbi:uncharacterized protein LOC106871226 [Octopus bimaculoides]|uniref:Profilin n=1 Tax=Octopus bimaculoides TaxID=37653 RepID=A0A0L8HFH1_OCTBM|nr:uncharacterized protein LOC106871226 [Octopus bimaculoides]XP_052828142.1 uncharacterized protein LOC106871226 [Octopus bimaculoides]|eukprot:XP_014773063.1 PREDICTED: uncharacterized protein LOC106871226 [Octopus bimaculoides]